MPTYPKTCKRSGRRFMASGPAARYCGKCAECKAADTSPKRKADVDERPRRAAHTGYQSEIPSSSSTRAGSPDEMVAQLRADLEQLDARRQPLIDAIDALIRLGQVA